MNRKEVKIKAVPCEVYSRVVGYFRPVSNWNDGKKREFRERKMLSFKKLDRFCDCQANEKS